MQARKCVLFLNYYCHALIFLAIFALASGEPSEVFIPCDEPSPEIMGNFITDSTGSNSRDSAVLVRELCPGLSNRTTQTWVRGLKVKDNCSKIPAHTAIATFAGKNGSYNRVGLQHAAIFISCNKQAIWVYDQSTHSKGVRQRRLRFGGPPSASNGNAFFTIV